MSTLTFTEYAPQATPLRLRSGSYVDIMMILQYARSLVQRGRGNLGVKPFIYIWPLSSSPITLRLASAFPTLPAGGTLPGMWCLDMVMVYGDGYMVISAMGVWDGNLMGGCKVCRAWLDLNRLRRRGLFLHGYLFWVCWVFWVWKRGMGELEF